MISTFITYIITPSIFKSCILKFVIVYYNVLKFTCKIYNLYKIDILKLSCHYFRDIHEHICFCLSSIDKKFI